MSNKIKVKMEGKLDQIVNYLDDIVNSLKQGKVVVQQGEEFVSLEPAENVFFEVEAKQKKGKEKISFELEWSKIQVEEVQEEGFAITSEEPKPAEKTEASETVEVTVKKDSPSQNTPEADVKKAEDSAPDAEKKDTAEKNLKKDENKKDTQKAKGTKK